MFHQFALYSKVSRDIEKIQNHWRMTKQEKEEKEIS